MWARSWSFTRDPKYDRLRGGPSASKTQSLREDEEVEDQLFLEQEKAVAGIGSLSTLTFWMQQGRQLVLAAVGLVCLWIVLVTAWRTTLHPVPRAVRYESQTLTCGNTTAEAQARGCAFDVLSHNWVAPACMDPVTESEYREYISSPDRKLGPYPYYLDVEGTQHIDNERDFAQLADSPTLIKVHTTREEHLAHCTYLLRRTARAADGKTRMNDENLQFWHAEHCLEELRHADRKPLDELNEAFYVGYAPCTVELPV